MSRNTPPTSPTLEVQLASIMDALAKAAVAEISHLFSESSAALRLQITRSLKENEALRTRTKVLRSELFSLRLQTRMRASVPASRFSLARANTPTPRTKPQVCVRPPLAQKTARDPSYMAAGPSENDTSSAAATENKCTEVENPDVILIRDEDEDEDDAGGCGPVVENRDDFSNHGAQGGVATATPDPEAPGSSCTPGNKELQIVSVHGRGEGPLEEQNDILFTVSELQAPGSPSPDPNFSHDTFLTYTSGANDRPPKRRMLENCVGLAGDGGQPDRNHFAQMASTSPSHVICALCGKTFVNKTTLNIHMRIHTGEKPYVCPQCGKRFTYHGSLKIHLRTHSGEKPYACSQCSASFNNPSNLRRHMVTHTSNVML